MKYLAIISHNLQELVETKNNVVPLHRQKENLGSAQAQDDPETERINNINKINNKIKKVC